MIPDPALVAALDEGVSIREIAVRFGDEAGRWASIQSELRTRARAKFGDGATRMLFVREALEQASHPLAARYRASLFPPSVEVVDLTAGIGADLTALAARGLALGFELDPERAAYAAHNSGVRVETGDALASPPTPYWIADPARRSEGRRLTDADEYAPPLSTLLERARGAELALVKLSPLLSDRVLEIEGSGLEFLSVGGECREAMLLLGSQASPGRRAVMVTPDAVHMLESADPGEATETSGAYLFDADPAAIRAHALGGFDLAPLGDSPGYLTGDEAIDSPWLRRYRVLGTGAFHVRDVKETLRAETLRVFETKKRGVGEGPLAKLKGLPKTGTPVSLILWAVGPSVRYALASFESSSEPLPGSSLKSPGK